MNCAQGSPLSVVLVDDDAARADALGEVLAQAGVNVLASLNSLNGLLYQLEKLQPDVVFVDLQSPGRDTLESLSVVSTYNPKPVVMFSENDDSDFIAQAVEAGVSAYVMDDIAAQRVRPLIDLAIAQFKTHQKLRQALNDALGELERNNVIECAKKLMMEKSGICEDKAHQTLRKLAMDNNKTLEATARSVIGILGNSGDGN